MLKHFKELIKGKKPSIQVPEVSIEKEEEDDGVATYFTMYKYFILDTINTDIVGEILLSPEQAKILDISIRGISFIRQ